MRTLLPILICLCITACGQKKTINKNDQTTSQSNDSIEIMKELDDVGKYKIRFTNNTINYSDPDSIPYDFKQFYNKFISDSIYQMNHIKFPLRGLLGECENSKLWKQSEWITIKWNFIVDFKNPLDSNIVSINDSKLYYENYRKEIGTFAEMGFEKINGEWFLVYYFINTC
jgi:hypothetical protein